MSFQTPITIAQAIENINNNRYLLPAIQREFEWSHNKIEWLFDSIMRDFPISSFLFWLVEGKTKTSYTFYSFLNEYRERYKTHNSEFNTQGVSDFIAVLDGQQRLTSIYLGLKGSYAYKKPRVRWINTEENIPTRKLYLNILEPLTEEEDGKTYEFKFLTGEQVKQEPHKWFKVGDILNLKNNYEFNKYLDKNGMKDNEFTYETLSKLHEKIHLTNSINYFLEKEQNLDKALNIFIRINSGGEPLSFSDLLMSIAVASWKEKNAREEINKLIDEIRDKGFFISKDFILKTFLVLYSRDIKFKVTNFSSNNAKKFEDKWDEIKKAIGSAFDLIKVFGFVESTLTSKNALIPIIYYLYHKNIYDGFSVKKSYEKERETIKRWLNIALIKRVFGGQADNILTSIRNVFTDDFEKNKIAASISEFPTDNIVQKLKGTPKDMSLDVDYIHNILLTQKDESLAFSILSLLYPNLDYKNGNFHKDHIHPVSNFNKNNLINQGIDKAEYEYYLNPEFNNSILNLQMLDANENMSKQDKELKEWVWEQSRKQGMSVDKFCGYYLIPNKLDFKDFNLFIEERKRILTNKLMSIV